MASATPRNCVEFITANRSIARSLRAKATELYAVCPLIHDIATRFHLMDLARMARQRALVHENVAALQECDLGVKCHCPKAYRVVM